MSKRFRTISPVDNSVYVEGEFARPADIESTLDRAVQAQRAWKAVDISQRAAICKKLISYFLDHADVIGEELSWQMGRPIRYTPAEITRGFQERAAYMIDIAHQALSDISLPEKTGFQRFIRRDPLGVILVLAPWNYPYLTSVNSVIPAIMAGNGVVLKPSQQTPLCAERYAEAFRQAGLPDGLFQYLHLTHQQVRSLIGDHRIAHVAFTGSVEGGQAVQRAIGKRFIGTNLELGGKDPAYVRPDADLAYSIENLVDGAFFNSGQSCCAVERIYVHQKVYDDFIDGFVELTKRYRLGDPLDRETTLGPMVKDSAAEFARRQIEEARIQGAESLIDPKHFPVNQEAPAYLAPQVLVKVHHGMRIMKEESFAPVVGIMPVADDSEALKLMNDSPYGLTASIWSADAQAAVRLGDQLETGTCFLNRCDYLDPALAWTGVKDSGKGCTLSSLGYESLTRPKSFHLKLRG